MKYGNLTIQSIRKIGSREYADCVCDCGQERACVPLVSLKRGHVKRCKDCAKKARQIAQGLVCAGAFKRGQL